MIIPTNKYQTPITDELLNSLPDEVKEQFFDVVNNVEFIRRLISPDRKYAKDLPRDKQGRIIVDIVNPHILEDMDYFRPTALHYKEHGTFTLLKPNSNPNSAYSKWMREEIRRCWDGYIRESDGEWVTGFMYWYINYCPIMLNKIVEGSMVADRVEDFPEMWEGIYWRFHYLEQARRGGLYNDFKGGNHACELARRGCSKSYTLASIMSHNLILGENNVSKKRTVTVLTAYQKEYLAGKDGTLNKFVPMIDFIAEHTQFPRRRLKDSFQDMIWQLGYKDVETGTSKGNLNMVMGVSSKDDESKLRGKRGYMLFEEFGSFPKVISIYNIVRYGVEEGNYVFGLIYLVGTAGDDASDFRGAQELLWNPKGYNIYALPNVYDKLNQGKPNISFFFPAYINRKGHYNKDGVSDVVASLIEILMNRYTTKYNSTEASTLTRVIAEMPITPSEAIIKVGSNLFPVTNLTERLLQLDSNPREFDDVYTGELVINGAMVEFRPTDTPPIRHFPHKDNKLAGTIEIFKMPEKDRDGKVYTGRYILSCDPYDDDSSDTMSLGSIHVLDLWTDNIVAEYTGRPMFADDFYEIARRMCLFYSGVMNYENNKKGLFAYFSKMNSLFLLADTLEFLKDKDMTKGTFYGNKSKGVNATAAINSYARNLIRAWLLKPVTVIQTIDGEDKEVTVPNLYTVRSRALLEELINYNPVGNFDRISSMGMLMLFREDRIILYKDTDNMRGPSAKASYLGNDDFFTRNYDARGFNMKGQV